MNTDPETTDGEWHIDYLDNNGEGFTLWEATRTAREISCRDGVKWAQVREMEEPENREVDDEYEYSDYEYHEMDEYYTPSATRGDYSPSCPWKAPGMSISDFI